MPLSFCLSALSPLKFSFARVERRTAKSKTIAKANTLFASELRRHRHGFWRDHIGYSSACGEHWQFNYNILCRDFMMPFLAESCDIRFFVIAQKLAFIKFRRLLF